MRVVIQRVGKASVTVAQEVCGSIGRGLLILVGFEDSDTSDDVDWIAGKILKLRVFDDNDGIMNLSVTDMNGDILVVSQFTLHASTRKGNRPSYIRAARPEVAIPLYDLFIIKLCEAFGKQIQTGRFGALMQIELINDGPVTIIIDSKLRE